TKMFCISCGTENRDGAQKCKECGNTLSTTNPLPSRSAEEAKTVFDAKRGAALPPPMPPAVPGNQVGAAKVPPPTRAEIMMPSVELAPPLPKAEPAPPSTKLEPQSTNAEPQLRRGEVESGMSNGPAPEPEAEPKTVFQSKNSNLEDSGA